MNQPDPQPASDRSEPSSITRRRLLAGAASGAGAGFLATLAACVNTGRRARTKPTPAVAGPQDEMPVGSPPDGSAPRPRVLTTDEWRTLEAALDVLLPSGLGSPGARDCNGIGYLDAALADRDTDPTDVELVRAGATWLDEAARNVTPRGAAGAVIAAGFAAASA